MCKPADNLNNCATCARASKRTADDNGHCAACIADDKTKGPFSRYQPKTKEATR